MAIFVSRTVITLGLALTMVSPVVAQTKPKREPSANQLATRERAKTCGAEWRQAKAAKTLADGTKWPAFWSACNKRLKGAQT